MVAGERGEEMRWREKCLMRRGGCKPEVKSPGLGFRSLARLAAGPHIEEKAGHPLYYTTLYNVVLSNIICGISWLRWLTDGGSMDRLLARLHLLSLRRNRRLRKLRGRRMSSAKFVTYFFPPPSQIVFSVSRMLMMKR
jgi:hypothetical protein